MSQLGPPDIIASLFHRRHVMVKSYLLSTDLLVATHQWKVRQATVLDYPFARST